VFVGLTLFSATEARSQEGFRAWVGLYEPAHLGWLENENRIGELCADPSNLDECYREMLGPKVSTYPLHSEPDASSSLIGDVIVVAVPGRPLSAHFRPAGSREGTPFTPDLFLQDWGYGPYFHHTVLAQQGDWFQLPPDPWEQHVWLHRERESESSSVIAVQPEDIIEMNGSSWYVVGAEPDALLLRAEQPGDLWCEPGDPPPTQPAEPTRRSRAELVDSRGHLVFRLKYLKGC
jgi:hypothetical protein